MTHFPFEYFEFSIFDQVLLVGFLDRQDSHEVVDVFCDFEMVNSRFLYFIVVVI